MKGRYVRFKMYLGHRPIPLFLNYYKLFSRNSSSFTYHYRFFFLFLLQVGDGGIIVLDATLDASTTDDAEWEISGGPPSPCDVSFLNDNVLINGRSNLSRTPRNHKVSEPSPWLL